MEKFVEFVEDFKTKFLAFAKQFGIIFLYLIIVVSLQLTLVKGALNGNIVTVNLYYLAIEIITLTIFILIFRKNIIPDFYDFRKNEKKYLKSNLKYWLIGLFVMVVTNLIISYFIGLPNNEAGNREILSKLPVYAIIAMTITAPIIEELMTRVILKDAFKRPIFYMIFSALIFGSLHLTSTTNLKELLFIIPYGALGFAFAKMYSKTNNIWTSIFFHSIHNFIAIILLFIGG